MRLLTLRNRSLIIYGKVIIMEVIDFSLSKIGDRWSQDRPWILWMPYKWIMKIGLIP